jgi:hypothetical protein
MWSRVRGAASSLTILLATAASACTGSSAQARGPALISPVTRALAICQEHYRHVQLALPATVAGVTSLGPRPVHPLAGPLARYKPGDAVALCLVPSGPGTYKAVAIVLISGQTYVRRTQNTGNQFTVPS